MRNGNVLGSLGIVWLVAISAIALPGVALCGGTALSDVLASSAPFLVSMAVATAMTVKQGAKAGVTRTSVEATHA
ncbi:hypothetical protein AB0H73_00175 [Streptomyces olivoreticuli]